MNRTKTCFVFAMAFTFILSVFAGPALAVNLSLVATADDGVTEKSQFMAGETILLHIVADDTTGLAGCAFTVTYDDTLIDPPATNADGTPVVTDGVASVSSIFPFTFQAPGSQVTEQMHRENSSVSGKVYLAGATIDEGTGGAKTGQMDAFLFTLIFKVKADAQIGSTFDFGLVQTELWNPDAGYGEDSVVVNGAYDEGEPTGLVDILVGAVAQGESGYDNFDCSLGDCAFPLLTANLPQPLSIDIVDAPKYSVTGSVSYDGAQTGNIIVGIYDSTDTLIGGTSIAGPDTFTITDVPQGTGYYLAAFRDSDDGSNLAATPPTIDLDAAEAQGVSSSFDVSGAVSGMVVALTDPDSNPADGIPDYWLNSHSGIGAASDDYDEDGYSNLVEYQNGTNPTEQDPPFGTNYNSATDNRGGFQILTSSPESVTSMAGSTVELTLNYNTSDDNNQTSGIWVSIHYDSGQLTYSGYTDWINIGGVKTPPVDGVDTTNSDGDDTTDRKVSIQAMSTNFPVDWPGTELPAVLAKLQFTVNEVEPGSTAVNIVRIEGDASYGFYGSGSTINVIDYNFDIDGSGDMKAFNDGLLIIRYLLGYPEFYPNIWINGAVDPVKATRTTAAEIEAYIQKGIDGLMLDIDGSGDMKAFNDGLLIIRYLLGYPEFYPGIWVNGAFDSAKANRTTAAEIEAYMGPYLPTPTTP